LFLPPQHFPKPSRLSILPCVPARAFAIRAASPLYDASNWATLS
jgi:hypothetical protein